MEGKERDKKRGTAEARGRKRKDGGGGGEEEEKEEEEEGKKERRKRGKKVKELETFMKEGWQKQKTQ